MPKKSFSEINKIVETVEGWLNPPVVFLLYKLASRLPSRAKIVEIGSWKGKSTVLLQLSNEKADIYAIDPHKGSHEHKELFGKVDTYAEFMSNIKLHCNPEKIKVLRKFSREAALDVPDGIDFLWIDGSHDYKDVRSDFELYFPKLKPGGWVAMHDYKWQGVKKFTWEILANSSLEIGRVRRVEDTHYFQKRDTSFLRQPFNQGRLKYYQYQQGLKRLKRKVRKKITQV